jgi:hypothetical protein
MAARAIVSELIFYPANYDAATSPIAAYQNYFPSARSLIDPSIVSAYNSFTVSTITEKRDTSGQDPVDITFAGTTANVDLVNAALNNRYELIIAVLTWRANLNNPSASDLEILTLRSGAAVSGTSDFYSVTLTLGEYADSVDSDMPFRRIPWTILGPLSVRR